MNPLIKTREDGTRVVSLRPGRRVLFLFEDALKVREAVDLPLILVGGLKTLPTIEDVLGRGFEGIGMARPLLRQPDFINRLRAGELDASPCEPCNKCMASMYYDEAVCPDLQAEQQAVDGEG